MFGYSTCAESENVLICMEFSNRERAHDCEMVNAI